MSLPKPSLKVSCPHCFVPLEFVIRATVTDGDEIGFIELGAQIAVCYELKCRWEVAYDLQSLVSHTAHLGLWKIHRFSFIYLFVYLLPFRQVSIHIFLLLWLLIQSSHMAWEMARENTQTRWRTWEPANFTKKEPTGRTSQSQSLWSPFFGRSRVLNHCTTLSEKTRFSPIHCKKTLDFEVDWSQCVCDPAE